jgi:hypothetical protein
VAGPEEQTAGGGLAAPSQRTGRKQPKVMHFLGGNADLRNRRLPAKRVEEGGNLLRSNFIDSGAEIVAIWRQDCANTFDLKSTESSVVPLTGLG